VSTPTASGTAAISGIRTAATVATLWNPTLVVTAPAVSAGKVAWEGDLVPILATKVMVSATMATTTVVVIGMAVTAVLPPTRIGSVAAQSANVRIPWRCVHRRSIVAANAVGAVH